MCCQSRGNKVYEGNKGMKKVETGNTKEYLEYCKQMHRKCRFTKIDHAMFSDPETKYGQKGWMNCGIIARGHFKNMNGTDYAMAVECCIGNGSATNIYEIRMHKYSHGVSIVKILTDGTDHIKQKYFVCGDEPMPIFGDFKEEHEELEKEEVLYLCNKNWLKFNNINNNNKYNIMFLKEFKRLFIQKMLFCNIIKQSKYTDEYILT